MKIFLASFIHEEYRTAITKSGHKNILISFFFIYGNKQPFIDEVTNWIKESNICLFLDSGAFSIRSNKKLEKQLSTYTEEQKFNFYAEYAKEYYAFVEKHYDNIYCFAEIDIDTVLGVDAVKKLRELCPQKIREKLCPVFHPETRLINQYITDCRDYKYQAIGTANKGEGSAEDKKGRIKKMAKFALRHGNKLHGFALVSPSFLKECPLASVDSSSWTMGLRFGNLAYFNPKKGRIEGFHYAEGGKIVRNALQILVKEYPEFMELWDRGGGKQKLREYRLIFAAIAYHKLEKYLTDLWKLRGIDWEND